MSEQYNSCNAGLKNNLSMRQILNIYLLMFSSPIHNLRCFSLDHSVILQAVSVCVDPFLVKGRTYTHIYSTIYTIFMHLYIYVGRNCPLGSFHLIFSDLFLLPTTSQAFSSRSCLYANEYRAAVASLALRQPAASACPLKACYLMVAVTHRDSAS